MRLMLNANEIGINDGMINMTNMWKACGGKKHLPARWVGQEDTKAFLEAFEKSGKCPSEGHFKTKRGMGGGTFAHPVIGLAYAKYLSPEFHIWCNERLLASGLIDVSGTAGF